MALKVEVAEINDWFVLRLIHAHNQYETRTFIFPKAIRSIFKLKIR